MQLDQVAFKSRVIPGQYQFNPVREQSLPVFNQDWRFVLQGLFLLAILISLTGCQTIGKPYQHDTDAIQAGHKSIVLFRMTAAQEKEGQITRKGIPMESYIGRIGKLDEVGPLIPSKSTRAKWRAPSKETNEQGWRYLVLDPGDYYLQLEIYLPATKAYTNQVRSFHVPTGKPVIYTGSLCFERQPLPRTFWQFLIDPGIRYRLTSLGVHDELSEAALTMEETMGEFGPVTASPMALYADQTNAFACITNRSIVQVEARSAAVFTTDDVGVDAASIIAAPLMIPGALFLGASQTSSDDTDKEHDQKNRDELIGMAFLLAAAPFAIAADKTVGEAARTKWEPYQAALEQEFSRFDLDERLANTISNRLLTIPVADVATNNELTNSKCIVRIKAYRVMLRETSHRGFALEMAALVQLVDTNSGMVLWQHDYAYGDYQTAEEFEDPYETWVLAFSTPHKLDEYRGGTGCSTFSNRIAQGGRCLKRGNHRTFSCLRVFV